MKKNRKPQIRRRTKETTGKAQFVDVIYVHQEEIDGVANMYTTCTCGQWRSSPEAKTFSELGREAKQHVLDTGHQLRKH